MGVPISCCVIVKNDPHLETAIASILPFVDDLVIVDTGSTDGTAEVAERLADRFETFTECNYPDGEIANFGMARERSFALASHDCVVWLDSDDLVLGAEHLRHAVDWCISAANGQPWRAKFSYEYERDATTGELITLYDKERVVCPKSAFRWWGGADGAVHEGLTCKQQTGWLTLQPPHPIVWRHEMDRTKKRSARNLRILRDYVMRVGVDNVTPNTALDLGVEYARDGNHQRAIAWLIRCAIASEWDEERVLAGAHLIDLFSFWNRELDVERWAHELVKIMPDVPDGYFALAKQAHKLAGKDPENEARHLKRAIHFAKKGLKTPRDRRMTPNNPADRAFNIPWIMQDAAARSGDPAKAKRYADMCAAARPDDKAIALLARKRAYESADPAKLDIVIACGDTAQAWDPEYAAQFGIGGSETAVIEMAKRLAGPDVRVRVFCRALNMGVYDDVEYYSMAELSEVRRCDVLIAWRNAGLLEQVVARARWLWVHDTEIFNATDWTLSLADRILALSAWHAEHLRKVHPAYAHKVVQTRNGIDLSRFHQDVPRNPHKVIFSSSPDRGLDQMLELWPRVIAIVPDAELHVFYGMNHFSKEYQDEMAAKASALPGVVLRGRVNQVELAREMLSAGVWVHPSWQGDKPFYETSCIGAMEAQAAGLRIVAPRWGALEETAGNRSWSADGYEPQTDEYKSEFAHAISYSLTSDCPVKGWDRNGVASYAREHFGWDDVADDWRSQIDTYLNVFAPTASTCMTTQGRPTLYMILGPEASGGMVLDPRAVGSEAMGGGSRVGFMGLTRAMAHIGQYHVVAFSTWAMPQFVEDGTGVEYRRLDFLMTSPKPDIAFAYYDTSPLELFDSTVLRIASHHTYAPYLHFDHADINTAPSEHALEALREEFEPTGQWHLLPNAVGDVNVTRRAIPGRVIYHTSPDRGLGLLCKAWPGIRKLVPHATLHVVGPVRQILDAKDPVGVAGRQARQLREAVAIAEAAGGLTLLGRLPRAELDRELSEASVFAFPCSPIAPCETFSISIMECCKSGIPVVLAPADALQSIYSGHVRMTPAPAREHLGEFQDAVVGVLTSEVEQARLSALGRQLAEKYTFENMASVLNSIIMRRMGRVTQQYSNGIRLGPGFQRGPQQGMYDAHG